MCLAVPGKILDVREPEGPGRTGTVDFQGTRLEVSLAVVPEAEAGDWVLVHAGLAIARLEAEDALETWNYLREAGMMPDQEQPSEDH